MNSSHQLPDDTSRASSHIWRDTRAMVNLGIPLVLIELAYMAIITTDVVMIGWLGPESLAAGSLGGHFFVLLEYFAVGVVSAVAPILAQHLGARRFRMVRRTTRQGFWMAVILSIPCIAIIWNTEVILVFLGQDPDLSRAAQSYLRIMLVGFLPGVWLFVLSEFLAAHGRPRATLVIVILGIGINALADYALIFGHFGFPRLGLVGAGYASAIVTSLMFVAILGFVLIDRRLRRYHLLGRFWVADWPKLFEIIRLGVPIALTGLAVEGMFVASALLMGLLGTTALAAHAIAVQCAAIAFMIPLGVSLAATVRVGRTIGAKDPRGAVRSGWIAILLGAGLAAFPALAFWFFGDVIVALFLDTSNPENYTTIELAISFLAIAALFQFADSTQVTTLGALRGLKDTRAPMLIAFSGYWGLGLSSAAFFGIYMNFGGQAIWIGMAVGLGVVSALLVWRFVIQARRLVDGA
jgi:multidrug resistance protein, MATE family